MRTAFRCVLLASTLVLLLAAGASTADRQQPYPSQGQQPPPPKQPTGTQPGTPAAPEAPAPTPEEIEEQNAFQAFFAGKDPDVLISSGEAFLKKYPASRFRASVYTRMAFAYRQLNDADKMFVAGEKALELNPDDLDTLSLMAATIPRRFDPDALDAEQKLARAERYARHAIELVDKLPKPANLTDEEFAKAKNQRLVMVYAGLGLVHFYRQQYVDMVTQLEKATQMTPDPEPVDLYLLGVAYSQVKRYSDAVTTFERCAAAESAIQDRCKQSAADSKKKAAAAPPAPAKP